MALKLDGCSSGKNLGVKVLGDLGDIQVTDAASDCAVSDKQNVSRTAVSTVNALARLPPNLVQNSAVPSFDRVAITNSENVQFGNNTYFHGPVTIKQIVQGKSGVENSSYTRSDDENISGAHSTNGKIQDSTDKKEQILVWHKITFSAVCITVIGSIIAIILVLQNKSGTQQQQPTNGYTQPDFSSSVPSGDPLLIAPDHLRIVSRTDWLAQPVEGELDKIQQPVPWVIISHTATESCHTQSQCVLRVRLIQSFHIESRGWYDIGYNFLVGGDGSVYYGRGWDYEGAHTKGYNKYSIGIAFIGTFNNDSPPKQQVEACQKIIRQGVELGKLSKDYKLFGHRQLMSSLSPGDKVYDIIKEWPHFVSNFSDINSLIPK